MNKRIKQLRIDSGLTIRQLSSRIGIPFNTYAGYEYNDNRKIPMQVIQSLSDVFGTTVEYIRNGSVEDTRKSDPVVIYVDRDSNEERIAYVPVAAQAGFLKNYTDIEYLKELNTYSVPGFETGTYRMFPVQGDSMIPTYYPGDVLICEPVENYRRMQDGRCYLIITTEGICIKRYVNAVDRKKVLIIESDNPEYKPDVIALESIIEIWSPKSRITVH